MPLAIVSINSVTAFCIPLKNQVFIYHETVVQQFVFKNDRSAVFWLAACLTVCLSFNSIN